MIKSGARTTQNTTEINVLSLREDFSIILTQNTNPWKTLRKMDCPPLQGQTLESLNSQSPYTSFPLQHDTFYVPIVPFTF